MNANRSLAVPTRALFLTAALCSLSAPTTLAQSEWVFGDSAYEEHISKDFRRGWGVKLTSRDACLTDAQRGAIREQLAASQKALATVIPGLSLSNPHLLVRFYWPLRAVGYAVQQPGVHGISNFVDQDAAYPDLLLDYHCGARTYDTIGGYNHAGTDYFTWPFSWQMMADDVVQIVAVAPGTILSKSDGNFDMSCSTGGGTWNAVYVQHDDGSIAWYGHMKAGSPTAKAVGRRVKRGEYLGVVGSSGQSTGPHLHLEVYDAAGNLVDPYGGPCNSMNGTSLWHQQRPYYDSAVNRITVGDAPAVFTACPGLPVSNEVASLNRGQVGYFTTYYRDQLAGQQAEYRLLRPDGTLWQSWTGDSTVPHYAASWWWWSWTLPAAGPTGTWTFEVEFEGKVTAQQFELL